MRAAVRSRFPKLFPGVSWEYFIIENPYKRVRHLPSEDTVFKEDLTNACGAREVTKKEAMEYVEEHGLVPCYETKDGIIWDTPGRDFQREFKMDSKPKRDRLTQFWE